VSFCQESQLEIAVKNILTNAGAEDYIPVFARHRITIETMMQLEDSDLKQVKTCFNFFIIICLLNCEKQ
jgi:hypothetical protein